MNNMLMNTTIIQGGSFIFSSRKRTLIEVIIRHAMIANKRSRRERVMGYLELTDRYLLDDFKAHFRLSRSTMELVINMMGNDREMFQASRGRPKESIKLVCLVAVWVLANQESYRSIADRFNIAKSTVYLFLIRMSVSLSSFGETYIKWPVGHRAVEVMNGFYSKRSFPGVIGAIDGCHIDIKAPKENSATYINRKGRPSMVLQGVCDNFCVFTDCFIGFPGSVHDARVFQKSGMLERCSNEQFFPNNSHLLGDSAYPLGPHILVPFKNNGHLTNKQMKYNVAHAATRATIERAFALLKNRWRRLFYLELHDTKNLPTVILAACILHNFCILHNDEIMIEDAQNNDTIFQYEATENRNLNRIGIQKRNYIVEQL